MTSPLQADACHIIVYNIGLQGNLNFHMDNVSKNITQIAIWTFFTLFELNPSNFVILTDTSKLPSVNW